MVRRTRPQMCNCTSGNLEIPGSRRSLSSGRACADPLARPGMTFAPKQKETRFRGSLPSNLAPLSAAMAMAVMPAITAMGETDRRQFDVGAPGRDVQPGLALHADRLQRVGIRRPADQKVAAETDTDRGVGADASVVARKISAPDPCVRRIPRPGQSGLVGDTEIHPIT